MQHVKLSLKDQLISKGHLRTKSKEQVKSIQLLLQINLF